MKKMFVHGLLDMYEKKLPFLINFNDKLVRIEFFFKGMCIRFWKSSVTFFWLFIIERGWLKLPFNAENIQKYENFISGENKSTSRLALIFPYLSLSLIVYLFNYTRWSLFFTRLRSRRVVMCLFVVYVRSFVRSFLLTYFDQTWNIEKRKYREGSRLYYIELQPPAKS